MLFRSWIASADPLDFPHERRPSAWTAVDLVIALMFVGVVALIALEVL